MKELLISEKPSVAKTYCELLENIEGQSFSKHDGYFESQNYYVSWCYGHLVEPADPSAYGWEAWDLAKLPMFPEKWKYAVKADVKKQFNVLKTLISKASCVINGADAGREGELIYRLVVLLSRIGNKPQKRLWANSFVLKDLEKSWKAMKPGEEYNNLYAAAAIRQKADWLVGMNLSRLYALKSNVRGLSVGRVQTPTLALIVERDDIIANWQRAFYYELHITYKDVVFKLLNDEGTIHQEESSKVLTEYKNEDSQTSITVTALEQSEKQTSPKRPFNLASLQQAANKVLNFTAKKTLDVTQKLYESKLVTYPRTDSEYLPENMLSECYQILKSMPNYSELSKHMHPDGTKLPFFNNSKVSDHFAIIPTGAAPRALKADEQSLYDLIANRYMTAFGLPYRYLETLYVANSPERSYRSIHNSCIDEGWYALSNKSIPHGKMAASHNISKGEVFTNHSFSIEKFEKTKPSHFTEASLIKAMETAGKLVDDQELRESMKENGLGTPATRAAVIETLKHRKYIEIKGKKLLASDKGKQLISIVDEKVSSPELTGSWENRLNKVMEGQESHNQLLADTIEYVSTIVSEVKEMDQASFNSLVNASEDKTYNCPKCKAISVKINKHGAFCNAENCDFRLFANVAGKRLSKRPLEQLLEKGETSIIKGFKGKTKEFDAALKLSADFTISFDFPEKKVFDDQKCPKCNSQAKRNSFGLFCDNCGTKVFSKVFGKQLTDKQFNDLISGKMIGPIDGLKSSKGKKFSAQMKLDESFSIKLEFNKK